MGWFLRVFVLVGAMIAVSLVIGSTSIYLLYGTAFEQGRTRLVEVARSRARLIEEIARWSIARDSHLHIAGIQYEARDSTLIQIQRAHERFSGFGRTGEFALAEKVGNNIKWLLRHRHEDMAVPEPTPMWSKLAAPMRRALQGQSGTMIGLDYRGVEVLAAYEPVDILNVGVVAKIDLEEIRMPFFKTSLFLLILSIILVSVAAYGFILITTPMVRRIETSERRFRTLVENQTELVCRNLVDGALLYVNPAYAAFFGKPANEFIGWSFLSLIPSGERKGVIKNFMSLNSEHTSIHHIHPVKRNDGEMRYIDWTHTATFDDKNMVSEILSVGRDITERVEATAEAQRFNEELETRVQERTEDLKAANDELEAFAYSVSHDLRGPLRAIDGFSQALLEDYADKLDGEARTYLNYLREGADRMNNLINDILRLSRATRGELEPSIVQLSILTHEVFNQLTDPTPSHPRHLKVYPGLSVYADLRLLRVVMENLLSNALKFSSKKSLAVIEVGVEKTDKGNVYFVKDNGAGFDMKYADKLFKPFQRLHQDTEFEGNGVGLSTVQRIIRKHGGEIWAEGEVGKGAIIRFTLPRYDRSDLK